MTKGEAKVLETDVVIFPMRFGQSAKVESADESEKENSEKTKTTENIEENRFVRLKKSLRKRSASIL